MWRLNKRDEGERGRGRGGRDNSICARKLKTLKMDKSDGCSMNTSLYITGMVLIIILAALMLGVVYNTIFGCGIQCVIAS